MAKKQQGKQQTKKATGASGRETKEAVAKEEREDKGRAGELDATAEHNQQVEDENTADEDIERQAVPEPDEGGIEPTDPDGAPLEVPEERQTSDLAENAGVFQAKEAGPIKARDTTQASKEYEVAAPPDGRVIEPGEAPTFDGEAFGSQVLVKENVYRKVMPHHSARPTYVLLWAKGTMLPQSTVEALQAQVEGADATEREDEDEG